MTTKTNRKIKKIRKKEKRRLLLEQGKNRHHIICKSRGGSDNDNNIAIIDVIKHRKYHHLFRNRNPEEIVEYLVNYFWNGNWGFVFEAIAKEKKGE